MARTKRGTVPAYRLHKTSGNAVVTIRGRDIYLGPHNSTESLAEYNRLIAEHLAGAVRPPTGEPVTVADLAAQFWLDTKKHPDLRHRERYKRVLGYLTRLYGGTLASDFGPLALQAVRADMLKADWTRTHLNQCVGCLKRVFKWGVSRELVAETVYASLLLVEDLRKGQQGVRESRKVAPVPEEDIEPVLAFAVPTVADMARLQLLTGARGGELCQMRPCDVDRSGPVWIFRPPHHKTEYLDEIAERFLGPRAQSILAPYLLRDAQAVCFSPKETMAKERKAKGQKMTTGRRAPHDEYTASSYGHGIRRACEIYNARANELERLAGLFGQKVQVRRIPFWHPHQLRHAAATRLVDEFGVEIAQKILGHRVVQMTLEYSRRAKKKAMEAVREIG